MSTARPRLMGALLVVLVSAVLLAGCATPAPPETGDGPDDRRFAADVDVDTPALRAAKERAGIADCPKLSPEAADGPDVGTPLPNVTLPCLGGGPDVPLRALRGPLVVNLWAQWCGPCREELPYYQELHERAGDRVGVLGVDYQDTRPDWALDLLDETGVTYPSVADPGADLRVPFRVRGLPGIVFVDRQGGVVAVEYLVIESFDQLAGLVDEHLGVAVGSAG